MQLKGIGIVCMALILLTGVSLSVAGENAGEMCVPMGNIELKPPEGVEPTKSTVEFPHSRHFATDCKACHHTWQGKDAIQSCSASGCHDQTSAPQAAEHYLSYSDVSIKYFKYAYHQACIGCHKDIKAKNLERAKSYQVVVETLPTAGPSGCIECHPK
jgi:hypothetical protein